ncbi:hypothetical protein IWZ01DRAFT_370465 [Phyllosticta capitalensis]
MDAPPTFSRLKPLPALGILSKFLTIVAANAAVGVAQNQNGSVPRCYYPNGDIATNDYACYLNTTESFCCTQNVKCLDNKICDSIDPVHYRYNRGTCTDKTWTSDACPNFCVGQSADYGSGVVKCPGTSQVCCDNGNNDSNATCCFDDSLFNLPGDWDAFRTINGTASTAVLDIQASTSISTTSTTASATSSPQNDSEGVGAGTIAGAAIGGVAGISVLILAALLYLRRRKRLGRGGDSETTRSRLMLPWRKKKQGESAELEGRTTLIHELAPTESRHELGVKESPAELSGAGESTVHEMEGSSPLGRDRDAKTVGAGNDFQH